jgi:serine/threonine protein kinase
LKDALQKEIIILQKFNCENIVKVYDVLESPNNIYIIQELCDTDLEGYIKKNKDITYEMAMDFLKQICKAFAHLVREGIVHRDIKPANILIKNGVFKLGDFGFAKNNVTANMQN